MCALIELRVFLCRFFPAIWSVSNVRDECKGSLSEQRHEEILHSNVRAIGSYQQSHPNPVLSHAAVFTELVSDHWQSEAESSQGSQWGSLLQRGRGDGTGILQLRERGGEGEREREVPWASKQSIGIVPQLHWGMPAQTVVNKLDMQLSLDFQQVRRQTTWSSGNQLLTVVSFKWMQATYLNCQM